MISTRVPSAGTAGSYTRLVAMRRVVFGMGRPAFDYRARAKSPGPHVRKSLAR